MNYPRQKPKHQEEWNDGDARLVCGLLKEFTLAEVAEKTGIDIGRIENKAQRHGWPIRRK